MSAGWVIFRYHLSTWALAGSSVGSAGRFYAPEPLGTTVFWVEKPVRVDRFHGSILPVEGSCDRQVESQ